jgi:hypothetical protein
MEILTFICLVILTICAFYFKPFGLIWIFIWKSYFYISIALFFITLLCIFYYGSKKEGFNDIFEIQTGTNKIQNKNYQSIVLNSLYPDNLQTGYINKFLKNDKTVIFDVVANVFSIIGDSPDLSDTINPSANYNCYISDSVDQTGLPTGKVVLVGQLHLVHQGGYQLHNEFDDPNDDNLRIVTVMLENSKYKYPILRGQFA